MNRHYTATEILAWENNDLAIERAIETLKNRLSEAPEGVLNDVMKRCHPDRHGELIGWLSDRVQPSRFRRVPRAWSPKRNRPLWILYAAADLDRPRHPPAN